MKLYDPKCLRTDIVRGGALQLYTKVPYSNSKYFMKLRSIISEKKLFSTVFKDRFFENF